MNSSCQATPSDVYECMLQIKSGKRGCMTLTKKEAKAANLDWSFVENAASILGLKVQKNGRWGFLVSRK